MGLGDEYELDAVEEETGNRARYEDVTDAEEPETQMEQNLQALKDRLADTEDDEIEVPEKYKHLLGPVGAGKSRRTGSIFEHEERRKLDGDLLYKLLENTEDEEIEVPEKHRIHTPKDRTKPLRKQLTDTEERDIAFRGHYHTPGWYRG